MLQRNTFQSDVTGASNEVKKTTDQTVFTQHFIFTKVEEINTM